MPTRLAADRDDNLVHRGMGDKAEGPRPCGTGSVFIDSRPVLQGGGAEAERMGSRTKSPSLSNNVAFETSQILQRDLHQLFDLEIEIGWKSEPMSDHLSALSINCLPNHQSYQGR